MVVHSTQEPLQEWKSTRSYYLPYDVKETARPEFSSLFRKTLAMYGLKTDMAMPSLVRIGHGQRLHLTTDACCGVDSVLTPILVETSDLEQYKLWIGTSDAPYITGRSAVPDRFLPTRPWIYGSNFDILALTPEQVQNIELAARCYLFGDSRLVASYRDAIVRCYAPFEAALYVAECLSIQADATLAVAGRPAVMLFDRLEIEQGGQLETHTAFRLAVTDLVKHEL